MIARHSFRKPPLVSHADLRKSGGEGVLYADVIGGGKGKGSRKVRLFTGVRKRE